MCNFSNTDLLIITKLKGANKLTYKGILIHVALKWVLKIKKIIIQKHNSISCNGVKNST